MEPKTTSSTSSSQLTLAEAHRRQNQTWGSVARELLVKGFSGMNALAEGMGKAFVLSLETEQTQGVFSIIRGSLLLEGIAEKVLPGAKKTYEAQQLRRAMEFKPGFLKALGWTFIGFIVGSYLVMGFWNTMIFTTFTTVLVTQTPVGRYFQMNAPIIKGLLLALQAKGTEFVDSFKGEPPIQIVPNDVSYQGTSSSTRSTQQAKVEIKANEVPYQGNSSKTTTSPESSSSQAAQSKGWFGFLKRSEVVSTCSEKDASSAHTSAAGLRERSTAGTTQQTGSTFWRR